MQKKRILEAFLTSIALVLPCAASAQVATPAAMASATPAAVAAPAAPVQTYTLGQLADMQRDVEFEKQRRALREAKGIEDKPVVAAPVKKKVKAVPKPVVPEGLQVRAIFGVNPDTTIRFYTASGQFEDRRIGETVQGWNVVDVKDEWVTLRKGAVTYPLALQVRSIVVEPAAAAAASEPTPGARNIVQAGALPSPKLASGDR
ncbi:hypothetical protein ACFPOU_08150 [Massilia jejuensis]|uniref:Type IV pilus biogenesis protein PilP n=1 Tax=Massilia jejuensis TaxID=648894 RepID=A0ABW0PHT9_9BURK